MTLLITVRAKCWQGAPPKVNSGLVHAVALRWWEDDQSWKCALISNVERTATRRGLACRRCRTPALLKELLSEGATIERFEMIEPSLHDIFVEKVTENS